jgi:large subunit ribosomal protein L7/L12
MALTKDQIIEAIEQMSLLDIVDLYKTMQDKWGVTPVAAVAAGPAAAAAPAAAEEEKEEKTTFDVILTGFDAAKKINVIKVVRELTSLGLKEAKDLVEGAPKPVAEGIQKDAADDMVKKLVEGGAEAKIQ